MGEALIVSADSQAANRLAEIVRQKGFAPRVWSGAALDSSRVKELQPGLIVVETGPLASLCQQLKLDPATNLIPVVEVGASAAEAGQGEPGFHFSPNSSADSAAPEEVSRAIDDALAWRDAARREGLATEFKVCLHSELGYLDELNKLLSEHFCRSGLAEAEAKQITMAIRELGANAIEWGHRKEVDRIVTIHSRLNARKLTIVIRDTGPGFDRCELSHAASHDDPVSHLTVREGLGLREGGFGIMIAGGLVDELSYNESGNEVCLVKHLSAPLRGTAKGG